MNFHKELAEKIRDKYFTTASDLINEGVDPRTIEQKGCAVVAWDGLARGELRQSAYHVHLRAVSQGGGLSVRHCVEMALRVNQAIKRPARTTDKKSSLRFYSSSPIITGRTDIVPQPIPRREALRLAQDIRELNSLGVLIATGRREVDHLLALIGGGGAILRVDAAARKWLSCLSNREAANLIRRGNRRGLVIDLKR